MNGFYSKGWSGQAPYGLDMPYGHPYMSGDYVAWLLPMLAFMLIICIAAVVFQIWLFYRIFYKAGYNGWWALLALVPGIGTLVVMLVLAFDNWPIHRGTSGGGLPGSGATNVTPNIAAQAATYSPTSPQPAAEAATAAAPAPAPSAALVTPSAEPPVPPVPSAAEQPAPVASDAVAPGDSE